MVFGSLLAFRNEAGGITEVDNPNQNLVGTGASWNSGAETIETLPANTTGYISFEGNSLDTGGVRNDFFVGFSRESDATSTGFTSIRYAIYNNIGVMTIYESGSAGPGFGFTNGDILSIHRDGATGAITYKRNGVTMHTSATTDTAELKGDFTAFASGDRAVNVRFERGNGEFTPFFDNLTNMTNT